MPKWVLPLLILMGLYLLSVGPLVTYFSRDNAGATMVPGWVRSYGGPYLWLYSKAPKKAQQISDGYFRWCKETLAKAEPGIEVMKDQATPRPPLPFAP